MAKVKASPRAKGSSIEDTIKEIKTKFGEESIMKLGESPRVDIDAISTGSIGLDWALGIGGLPVEESSKYLDQSHLVRQHSRSM